MTDKDTINKYERLYTSLKKTGRKVSLVEMLLLKDVLKLLKRQEGFLESYYYTDKDQKIKIQEQTETINRQKSSYDDLYKKYCDLAKLTNEKIPALMNEIRKINESDTAVDVYKPIWISTSERMPETTGRYLVYCYFERSEIREVFDLWYEDGCWLVDECGDRCYATVTHWTYLPNPPKEE